MVEILFWMWVSSIIIALLFSSAEHRTDNIGIAFAFLPVWACMMVPLTMIGWVIEIVKLKAA